MTHICVGKVKHYLNQYLLLIRRHGTYFSEILNKTKYSSFNAKKCNYTSSSRWRPFRVDLNVLKCVICLFDGIFGVYEYYEVTERIVALSVRGSKISFVMSGDIWYLQYKRIVYADNQGSFCICAKTTRDDVTM